jgi:hypothetical protein
LILTILATFALTDNDGSELVQKFRHTLIPLNRETSLLEFLTMLSGNISSKVHGPKLLTQTPQMDVFPHLPTMIGNAKK